MIIPKDLIIEAKEKLGDKAAFLIAKDLNLEQFDEKNLKALCHWHHEDTPSLIWNPKNNSYKCFGCGKNYDIIDHYMSYEGKTYIEAVQKLFEQAGISYSFGEKGIKVRDYKYPEYTHDNNRDNVEKYLALRKISVETLNYFDIKQLNGNIVFNYYNENDVLTTVKIRPARKIRHGESKMWFLPNADNKPILFGMNKSDPTKPLVLTEGEIDSLSVFEAGYSNVVSIPGGTENKKWIDECWNWLEQFEKIILWFDNDLPGIKARKDVASRLGTWRTLIIDVPPTIEKEDGTSIAVKDANEILYYFGKEKVMQLIANAQEIPVSGVSNLASVGDFNIKDADGLYTHLKPIDDIVYKFIMGSVVVVTGKAGCVDCDTEYFNGKEWKRISEYNGEDSVLQFNADKTANLVKPLAYHKYPAETLKHFKTQYGIDQVLSEEHEIVYYTSKHNLAKKSVADVIKQYYKTGTKNIFNGFLPGVFIYNGIGIPYSNELIRLMVASICDGSYYNNVSKNAPSYNQCRFHIKKDRKKDRLRWLFEENKLEHWEHESAAEGYIDLYVKMPFRIKEFDNWWYNCSQEQLKIIVEECLFWDGHVTKNRKGFSTAIKKNADFVQFAATATGHVSNISVSNRIGKFHSKNSKYQYKTAEYTVVISNRTQLNFGHKDGLVSDYKTIDGYKYCFTVPSSMLVLRRNNKIFITGNSGKSSLINQIFINESLNQGYDIFCYSGELDAKVLKSWIDLNLAGEENIIPSSDPAIRVIKDEAKAEINKWYDGRVWIYDNISNKAKDIIDTGINVTRKYGAKIWVIDNLMMLDLEDNESDTNILQKQKEFMSDLVRIAHTYNILIILVIHPRKVSVNQSDLIVDDVAGSGNLVNLSQYVLSVRRISEKEKQGVEDKIHGGYKKGFEPIPYDISVDILKNRYTGKLGLAPLNFEYSSYRFYSNDEERYRRYKWNKSMEPIKQFKKINKQDDTGDNFFIG